MAVKFFRRICLPFKNSYNFAKSYCIPKCDHNFVLRRFVEPKYISTSYRNKLLQYSSCISNSVNMRLGKIDPNSYSEPEKVVLKHVDLDWTVDFKKHVLIATAIYDFVIIEKSPKGLSSILLDVRDIKITDVFCICSGTEIPVNFFVGDHVEDIGAKLTIELPQGSEEALKLKIVYETSSNASALQWLTPEQTLGKKHPYLFSQCQAIHARSILPCQDTPSVKFTYRAKLTYPEELNALMSAIRVSNEKGVAEFQQTVPIPAYLLAIAIGNLVCRKIGPISHVWAEEGIIEACAFEFSETSEFLNKAEEICGPYVWKQYDLLVMPPSFPFGGMENPCLTFVTPTLLAGDKSLADVVAHEIAHSWTGNLVTNKNFEHFWLNEGFTVFIEAKIVGRMKGDKERDFHSIRNLTELKECIRTQLKDTPQLTKLVVDLSNLGPDDAFSSVPYIKGSTFLRYMEDILGGPDVFEPFLRSYFETFKYKSVLTGDFKAYMYDYFGERNMDNKLEKIDWDLWLYGEGMPPFLPKLDDSLAIVSSNLSELWSLHNCDDIKLSPQLLEKITSQQIIDFLGKLIECSNIVELNEEKILLLERTYNLKSNRNSEVKFRFLRLCIRAKLMDRMDEIIAFANSNFRMKFVRPIYRDLANWPEAKPIAIENFNRVKDQMMTVCSTQVARDLGLK
ncbi:leukotriene A-4 hydrolase-like [Condylostylus longicornis]|uniref:leukotriene A-4 hydrolase-like n=1 Tax=Condylostylus longicornis TaxID=2530218 RepID=UPI00244E05F4|nr:leukotriene A-4 hydrolase-like [Condylostylus longicornis]